MEIELAQQKTSFSLAKDLGWMAGIPILFLILSVLTEKYFFLFVPVAILCLLYVVNDVRRLMYLFALVIPFSIEMELPGGLGTDFPSEQIMWLMTAAGIVYFIFNARSLNIRFLLHPISLLIGLHLGWMMITVLTAQNPVLSIKFLMAKLWYVIPFYILFYYWIIHGERLPQFFTILFSTLFLAIGIVMIRHGLDGFSFKSINEAVHPIFRNHVNYACMLVALLPYLVWKLGFKKGWSIILLGVYVIAIYLSFTRAAILSIFIATGIYIVVRLRLMVPSLLASIMIVLLGITYFIQDNRFMDYAPEYERAIAHYKFDNLIDATYKLEDISTMERLYRWMAGLEMVKEKPVFGFGPNGFYPYYQDYSLSEFQTYVSHNPEKSGIHNYYLMLMVEQGILGGLIFIALIMVALIYGERVFHKSGSDKKGLVMAAIVSIGVIASVILINDLIEADKVGPFLFIGVSIIAAATLKGEERNFKKSP